MQAPPTSLGARVRRWLWARPARTSAREWQRAAADFSADPAWAEIAALRLPKTAIVLVAERERILARVRERREIEQAMSAGKPNVYPGDKWLHLYASIDLPALYSAWVAELARCGIACIHVDSNDPEFRPLPAR